MNQMMFITEKPNSYWLLKNCITMDSVRKDFIGSKNVVSHFMHLIKDKSLLLAVRMLYHDFKSVVQ